MKTNMVVIQSNTTTTKAIIYKLISHSHTLKILATTDLIHINRFTRKVLKDCKEKNTLKVFKMITSLIYLNLLLKRVKMIE